MSLEKIPPNKTKSEGGECVLNPESEGDMLLLKGNESSESVPSTFGGNVSFHGG